ncbi:MAG: S8 family serine peptidase, partial [candidate division Zixibacteria bacterium]|nr:S8 family serine peptidase [candidate division Zixibacteria bacterium]
MKQLLNFSTAIALILIFAVSSSAGTFSSDFEQYLIDNQSRNMVGAIITLTDQVDLDALKSELYAIRADRRQWHEAVVLALQEKATQTQGPILAQLDELAGQGLVEDYRGLWIANLVLVTATEEALDILVARDDVLQINPEYQIESVKPVDEGGDQPLIAGVEIGLERIHAPECWAMGITGSGRLVSHLDTGVDGNHAALNARWRGYDVRYTDNPEWAWFDPVSNTMFPFDAGQHGTHTMGTICGLGESTGDTIGVAFGAEWMSAGVIDRVSIPQTVADALLSFEWLVDPDTDPSTAWDVPDVCSNSWGVTTGHGYPPCDQTFWTALDGLEAAGVVVVFAAGNEGPGPNSLRRPSDRATTELTTFSVAALDGNNESLPIASFSSRGPSYCTPDGEPTFKPEVSAPGVNVRSSVPGGGYQGGWSGTSMACPHIAGVVALMRQANPNLTTDQVKQIMLDTAEDLGSEGEDNDYGMGIVNAYECVLRALAYLEGWGTLAGQITDEASGTPLQGAIISVEDRPWAASSNADGWYYLFMPADTLFDIRVDYPPTHLPIFDAQMVAENETLFVDYALEGKVSVTLTVSFGNPDDIDYRSFYLNGSWDNDGFYDGTWSGDLIEIWDNGEAPDETAGDGIFTAELLLARDLDNSYSWSIYTENYNLLSAVLADGADFDIPDLDPPVVPTLEPNPSGSDNNFVFSVEGNNDLSLDLMAGIDNTPSKWGASDSLYEGITYVFEFYTMHSDFVTYGSGGVGGEMLTFTPEVDGPYDFIFNDMDDSYIVQLTGTEGPPGYLSAQSGFDGHIPVGWLPPGVTESNEMAYDDGALENAYYYYDAANLMATMFVPESYPVSIDSVMIHVLTEGD